LNSRDSSPMSFSIVSPAHLEPTLFRGASAQAPAPYLPTTRKEMEALGWDACDVVLVTGDAYIDHPSFGMALVGRLLEAHGYRVGIIDQPDWRSADAFRALGKPRLYFGVTAGNMDSMVNRYTADKKIRRDDAYSPDGQPGLRPDRAVIVYAQRCREAFRGVSIVIGGIEASLRRTSHYDHWSDKVRRSVLFDAKADLLVYGNGERQVVEITQRLDRGESIRSLRDIRGTAFAVKAGWLPEGFAAVDSQTVDTPGHVDAHSNPYAMTQQREGAQRAAHVGTVDNPTGANPPCQSDAPAAPGAEDALKEPVKAFRDTLIATGSLAPRPRVPRSQQVVRLPDSDAVVTDKVLYAHASRVVHRELNPGNARALSQRHGDRDVWITPPALPLTTEEMDRVYELPYARTAHPRHKTRPIPAYDMIKTSVTIMRGCFGGCTFCSITEHEGRIIQSRSEGSILREIETVRDTVPGFSGVISDVGGPTANMYRLACKDPKIEAACRLPSCVYPGICKNLNTDHTPLIRLYKKARALPGIKKVLVASGVRYDLAVESPAYIKELATHHTGGYLKIAPEHTEDGPLSKMLKPGIGSYDRFKELFDRYTREAGKEQYLIPYFIAAHPGTTIKDMAHLALWLKKNKFRPDQVQTFMPTPMATASAMYHTGKNPLKPLRGGGEDVEVPRELKIRQTHKAFLRYHDEDNWPLIRRALKRAGLAALIGNGPEFLVPPEETLKGWKAEKQAAQRRGRNRSAQRAQGEGSRVKPKRESPGKSAKRSLDRSFDVTARPGKPNSPTKPRKSGRPGAASGKNPGRPRAKAR